MDTIFALASGIGRAAVAVMRISGPQTYEAVSALTRGSVPPARHAGLRQLRDSAGDELDRALVLWLPGPGSYTGEDSAELHLHAGRAVVEGVCWALAKLGLRPAEPGEFTRRAFLSGRMELTEAEAVADLIAAETEAQRRQALRQLDGELGQLFDGWAARLRRLLAWQEALIDFPEDTEDGAIDVAELRSLMTEIAEELADERRGEKLREGLRFVVGGPPNVGKSSLVNALAGREAAIVTPIAGTTRDVIDVRIVLGGVPVTLTDTAGLRESADPIEAEGVRRARCVAEQADLFIDVAEAGTSGARTQTGNAIFVASKIDLGGARGARLGVSVVTGEGIAELRQRLAAEAERLTQKDGPPPLTRARHRAACESALGHLDRACADIAPELRGEELRLAMRALGRVTGRVGVEDLLDSVFSQFCIGK